MSIADTKPTIVNTINAKLLDSLSKEFSFWMVTRDGKWAIHFNRSWQQLAITDTSNFYKSGTTKRYVTHAQYGCDDHYVSLRAIIRALQNGEEFGHELLEKVMKRSEDVKNKSVDAFNPFSISHIKPFKYKGDRKIRRDDIVKMLVNKQFTRIQIDARYTDDYAFDAATDFSKGRELDPMNFLKRYLELFDQYVSIDEDGKKAYIEYGNTYYSISLK